MSRLTKLGLVFGGYTIACLAAGGIAYLNQLFTRDAASQASAGMAAFGDFILFILIFGFLALFPSGLLLYFLFRKILRR